MVRARSQRALCSYLLETINVSRQAPFPPLCAVDASLIARALARFCAGKSCSDACKLSILIMLPQNFETEP